MIITFPSQEKVLCDYYCYCNHFLNNHPFSTKLLYIIFVILNISPMKDIPRQYYPLKVLRPGFGSRTQHEVIQFQFGIPTIHI